VNIWEMMPILLLVLFGCALSIGIATILLIIRRAHTKSDESLDSASAVSCPYAQTCFMRRPGCWLAIRSRNLLAVQAALALHNPKPCPFLRGLSGEEKLFIAPPVKGWILVTGSGLPDPSEDVDACFRFVVELSRKLGQVQYFSASRVLHHHAWVKADGGRVVRAYAWAGRTLWKQGSRTSAEKELDVRCFDYLEPSQRPLFGQPDLIAANVDKVPLLAARWSLDPARIDERLVETVRGIAGEPSRRY
jgi:hypothetical protein